MCMAKSPTMAAGTWTDFRDAAIAGDIQHVKTNHSRKDFRLYLNQDQSALDLAARHGHDELVDYFLGSLVELTRDDKEWLRIVNSALRNACKGAQEEMVRCLVQKLVDRETEQDKQWEIVLAGNDHIPSRDLGIYISAIACNNINVLKLILDYFGSHVRTVDDEARSRIIVAAFGTGEKEILSTVMEDLELKIDELPIDSFYTDCALGNAEKVLKRIDDDDESCRKWYEKADLADAGNVDFVYGMIMGKLIYNKPFRSGMSVVGVAARFGHFQLVKDLLLRIESKATAEGLADDPSLFTQTVDEVLLQAWCTDRLDIVQWLHESNRTELQPPFRYNGINAFGKNRVFDYVSSVCPSLDGLFDKPKPAEGEGEDIVPVVNNILDILSERSIPVIDHYIEACGAEAFSSLREYADRSASVYVLDDCSLFLSKLKPFLSPFPHPCTDDNYDKWRPYYDYSEMSSIQLPCLPVLETLVDLSSSCEGDCQCGREMLQFLMFADFDSDGIIDYGHLPYDLVYNTVSAAMALMLKKKNALLAFPLPDLFSLALKSARHCNSQILARLLCFLDYVDVSDMIHCISSTSELFVNLSKLRNRAKLDAIYRNLLRGLAGCENPALAGFTFPGLLRHTLFLSEHLRNVYFNLIRSLGFRMSDIWVMFDGEIRRNHRSFYDEVSSFSNPPVPTLKNMVRIQIYRRLREDQTRLREKGQVLSFQEMVENFVSDPEIKTLPDPLPTILRLPPMVYIKTGT